MIQKLTTVLLILMMLSSCKTGGGGGGTPMPNPPEHRTSFLFDNAKTSEHVLLSTTYDHNRFMNVLNRKKANGDTVWYVYFYNEGDYGGSSVSFYSDGFAGTPDQNKITFMQDRLKIGLKMGFRTIAWGMADDSRSISRANVEQKKKYFSDLVTFFNPLIGEYVIGLELQEHTSVAQASAIAAHLKGLIGNKRIGVHETTNNAAYIGIPQVDTLYFQYGFGRSCGQIQSMTRNGISRAHGKRFIAAEYHKSSDSAQAKALGDCAVAAGAQGTGNGRN